MSSHAPSTPSDGLDEVMSAVEEISRSATPRAPAMEMIEEPGAFVLVCEMGGADRDDIRVDVSPNRVVVAALPRSAMGARPGRDAAVYRDFERAVPLPREVDPEGAEARLNNGILEVVLPKRRMGGTGVHKLPAI